MLNQPISTKGVMSDFDDDDDGIPEFTQSYPLVMNVNGDYKTWEALSN